jgi:crotonobetainyl-CoA:carnitine CoA-transferase CaiB-like acyl-CoA transferase
MQALTGLEWAVGGSGNVPIAPSWIPIDVAGGWLAATSILAGLYCRAASGSGQIASSSLLGAGMLLQSGVFLRNGEIVRPLEVDTLQTGYGPGYRIYESSDGAWFALVIPDQSAWDRLNSLIYPKQLPHVFTPLRGGDTDVVARRAEVVLEKVFATRPAQEWVLSLRDLQIPAELVRETNRDQFRRDILDDPLNRQLGRVSSYETSDWGMFEQIGPLLRFGPFSANRPCEMIPAIGEHTRDVLAELGCTPDEINNLIQAKIAHQAT